MPITRNIEEGQIYINKWITGLVTQRSSLYVPISAMGLQVISRQDAMIDGLNTEISSFLTPIRRYGYARFCSQQFGSTETPLTFISYKSLSGNIAPVVDTTTRLATFTSTGLATIWPKAASTQMSAAQVGNMLYLCNGAEAIKWDGTLNWMRNSQGNFSAWAVEFSGVTSDPIITDNNATAPDGTFTASTVAYPAITGPGQTLVYQLTVLPQHVGQPITFSVWLRTVTGTATFLIFIEDTIDQQVANLTVTSTWTRYSVTMTPTVPDTFVFAGTQSSSATGSVPAITLRQWGAQLEYASAPSTYVAAGNNERPVSNWGIAAPVLGPTISLLSGSLSPKVGYQYVYAYKNSATGHVSTTSPMSGNTGPQTSKNFQVGYTSSTDPQVDTIVIFRTDDGGANFFELTEVPNATATFTDSLPDTSLNDDIVAPLVGNDPPPTGISLVLWNVNRLLVAAGNLLYYSTGPDVTDGVAEESFNADNVFTCNGSITANVSTSVGVITFTGDDLFVLTGTDAASFSFRPYQKNFGVVNQNCVAADGDNVFVLTSRGLLWQLGANPTEIGQTIRAKLAPFVTQNPYLVVHTSGDDEGVFVSNGVDSVYRYSQTLQNWSPVAMPVGGIGALGSVETSQNIWTLCAGRAAGSGYILGRNQSVFQDDGVSYPAFMTVGSLIIAAPGKQGELTAVLLEATPVGTYPTISILLNEVSGTFVALPNPVADPPKLSDSTSIWMKRHYLKSAQTPLASNQVRHCQIKITFATEAIRNEIIGLAVA